MAKLNVEVTKELFGLETEVTYNGNKYVRTIGEAPRKGDIIKVVNGWGSIEAGDFYEDIREEHMLYSLASDANDKFTFIKGEPGDASTTLDNVIVFRKVDEQPAPIGPGTKIKIVNPHLSIGQYDEGDVFTIKSYQPETEVYHEHYSVEEISSAIYPKEFEILEEPTFKAGDKVRLLSGGGDYPLHGFRTGSEYAIKAMPEDHTAHPGKGLIRITGTSGIMHGYARPDQLELVEEESEQAPEVKIEYGDIVIGKRADLTLVGEVEDVGEGNYGVRALFLAKGRGLTEYRAFDVSGGDTVTLIAKKADRKDLEG